MKYMVEGKEFTPKIEVVYDLIPHMAGISMRDFCLDKQQCAEAWKTGPQKLAAYFGDRLPLPEPAPAPISYGHLICLGAPCNHTEEGEPNVSPFAGSIDEAIEILQAKKGMDYQTVPMFQHYLEIWAYLKEQFPDVKIPFYAFGAQGPVTSTVLMRGQDFFCDLYDEPEKAAEFIMLMADSVVDYRKYLRRMNGDPEEGEGGLCDDFASLVSPDQWPVFVIPAMEKYYSSFRARGNRYLHLENLTPKHLPYLNNLKITHYQPSVSDMITVEDIKASLNPDMTFDLLLYPYHITDMTDEEIQQWVDQAVRSGAVRIRTEICTYTAQRGKFDRITAFHRAFDKYRVE